MVEVVNADCMEWLAERAESSVDAIVTDPPYGLGFMGHGWDALPPGEEWARLCLKVLKPGGHLLAFGGTRTWHRLAVAVEDAGFEMRDSIAWMHSQGFPKGKNLKPSFEPIVVARKPFTGSAKANVAAWGTGELNIEDSRIATSDSFGKGSKGSSGFVDGYAHDGWVAGSGLGRWPANVMLDEDQAAALDVQSGFSKSSGVINRWTGGAKPFGGAAGLPYESVKGVADEGGASRFFFVAKANKRERPVVDDVKHPTVKPLALMRHLVKLATPVGGVVLDPFAGSGTTVEAAVLEGFDVIGVERESKYIPLIEARLVRHG